MLLNSACVVIGTGNPFTVDLGGDEGSGGGSVSCSFPDAAFEGGSGTALDPYLICNAYHFSNIQYNLSASFLLINNIDFQSASIVPITGDFSGMLDGSGFTLKNATLSPAASVSDDWGLFAHINGGTIQNLTLDNIVVSSSSAIGYTGSLAGHMEGAGSLMNIHVIHGYVHAVGTSSISAATGGVVGCSQSVTGVIDSISFDGVVEGLTNTGGIIGFNNGATLTNMSSFGTISGRNQVGGVVGFGFGGTQTYQNLQNYSNISCTGSYCAGILGRGNSSSTIVAYSKNFGNISADIGTALSVGGLIGSLAGGTLDQSFSSANVSGYSGVGGAVGSSSGSISNSYAHGTINGDSSVGGLVGSSTSAITNSYTDAIVSGTGTDIGPFIGASSLSGTDYTTDYWVEGRGGFVSASDGWRANMTPEANMATQATFVGWDFTSIWGISAGFPVLRVTP